MANPFVDTDVIIRLLTGDDPGKQAAAAALFESVEARQLTLQAPDTVIADAVYVLASSRLYARTRDEVRELLSPLVRLPDFRVQNRRVVLRALDIYATTRLDFGDAMIAASMERVGSRQLYSYDAGFDRISSIEREQPKEPD